MFDITTIQEIEGEARMRDLDIAEALGFEQLFSIRKLIYRKLLELSEFGIISTVETISGCAGRTAVILGEYQRWCRAANRTPMPEFTFSKRLSKMAEKYSDPKTGHGFAKKSSVSGYFGIAIPIAQQA